MEKIRNIEFTALYKLCNEHQLFTYGSNYQYGKMFELAEKGTSRDTLCAILYISSDLSYDAIYSLTEELYK